LKLVTLVSDFGLRDGKAAAVRALLQQYVPNIEIIDVSHEVETYDVQGAAYVLQSSYRHFPKGTCHVAFSDIFYRNSDENYSSRLDENRRQRLVVAEVDGQYFLAPDNGLLLFAFGGRASRGWQCYELQEGHEFYQWVKETAKAVNYLQSHPPSGANFFRTDLLFSDQGIAPVLHPDGIECYVRHIDRFGNVVLNITRELFNAAIGDKEFSISVPFKKNLRSLSTSYDQVEEQDILCRFNGAGLLELSVNHGSAESLFGLSALKRSQIYYRSMKIYCDSIPGEAFFEQHVKEWERDISYEPAEGQLIVHAEYENTKLFCYEKKTSAGRFTFDIVRNEYDWERTSFVALCEVWEYVKSISVLADTDIETTGLYVPDWAFFDLVVADKELRLREYLIYELYRIVEGIDLKVLKSHELARLHYWRDCFGLPKDQYFVISGDNTE
jgi:S-adenosyl-L-methionine hydrolase (adenosine-forming)